MGDGVSSWIKVIWNRVSLGQRSSVELQLQEGVGGGDPVDSQESQLGSLPAPPTLFIMVASLFNIAG